MSNALPLNAFLWDVVVFTQGTYIWPYWFGPVSKFSTNSSKFPSLGKHKQETNFIQICKCLMLHTSSVYPPISLNDIPDKKITLPSIRWCVNLPENTIDEISLKPKSKGGKPTGQKQLHSALILTSVLPFPWHLNPVYIRIVLLF